MSRRKHTAPPPAADRPPADSTGRDLVPPALRSLKIGDAHLQRLAVVYIRQSSQQQVLQHRESRERQDALVEHAVGLGWPRARVLVIDEDQGHSGKDATQRGGFHRLLAEVAMNHVGLILGLEMSRLARSSKDWHQLLEMCTLVGTILADEDGVYDPHDANDRLLLGLKGPISEFELVTMHNRLERGKRNKAQRGELFALVPTGYVKVSPGQLDLDPDEQVRDTVRLVFDKFDEIGTLNGVFRYLVRNRILLGVRPNAGPNRGHLEWQPATLCLVRQILTHPRYAGVYPYGRRRNRLHGPARGGTATGNPAVEAQALEQQFDVFQRDRLPAYITWDRYLANQERLRQNRCRAAMRGTPRQGTALLAGLIRCGTCGRRLRPRYGRLGRPSYLCVRHLQDGTDQTCYGLRAADVDALVVQQVLQALEPAALELSLQAVDNLATERGRLERSWQQRLERARYASQEAQRRYLAVEPENRLVARTREARWEEALRSERELTEAYDRFQQETPLLLSADERALIEQLATDIPGLWQAPGTTVADRKTILRHLGTDVVVQVQRDSEYVPVTIHWQGGFQSQHVITRAVRSYAQQRDYQQLLDRVRSLWRSGASASVIADQLNASGFVPPHRRCSFTGMLVRRLLCRLGYKPDKRSTIVLEPNEWWLTDLAEELELPSWKLRQWGSCGWLHYRQTPTSKLWIIWADAEERRRLRKLKARSRPGRNEYPKELITPKKRAAE